MKRVLGILLTVFMMMGCCYFSSIKKEEVVVNEKPQIIETQIHYLTDGELSQLYSCRQDYNKDTTICFTQEEAEMLMKLAQCEAGGCTASQYYEMMVVVNRLKSDEFPDTVKEIIYQTGQFSVVSEGKFAKAEPTLSSHLALAMVEKGIDWSEGAIWVEASSNSSDSWHSQNKEFLYELFGQRYYK